MSDFRCEHIRPEVLDTLSSFVKSWVKTREQMECRERDLARHTEIIEQTKAALCRTRTNAKGYRIALYKIRYHELHIALIDLPQVR